MRKKTSNTGAEKLRGRTHPMTHDVYLLYRLFKDSSTKSYGEEKPNRYSTNNTYWVYPYDGEPRLSIQYIDAAPLQVKGLSLPNQLVLRSLNVVTKRNSL